MENNQEDDLGNKFDNKNEIDPEESHIIKSEKEVDKEVDKEKEEKNPVIVPTKFVLPIATSTSSDSSGNSGAVNITEVSFVAMLNPNENQNNYHQLLGNKKTESHVVEINKSRKKTGRTGKSKGAK